MDSLTGAASGDVRFRPREWGERAAPFPLGLNTASRDVPDEWPLTAPLFLEAFENEVEMLLYGIVSLDAWTAALRLG